jgi:hypothetical protein
MLCASFPITLTYGALSNIFLLFCIQRHLDLSFKHNEMSAQHSIPSSEEAEIRGSGLLAGFSALVVKALDGQAHARIICE